MPPISIVFVVSGLAVFVNGLYFLGIGTKPVATTPAEGEVTARPAPDPAVSVGWITLVAGLVDLVQAALILAKFPGAFGEASPAIPLGGLIAFYGTFFVVLGVTLVRGLDLRVVGNLAIPVALVPLCWIPFFIGGWMFISILILWIITFLAVTLTTYGKLPAKVLGVILTVTALYAFLLPAALQGLGIAIP